MYNNNKDQEKQPHWHPYVRPSIYPYIHSSVCPVIRASISLFFVDRIVDMHFWYVYFTSIDFMVAKCSSVFDKNG